MTTLRSLGHALADSRPAQLGLLVLFILVVKGAPVPWGNELVYLLSPYAQWHPEFLKNDWTFASGWPEHRIFNLGAGLLMLVASPEVVGWLGRIVCWALILAALLRLGRRFDIPLSLVSLSIVLWVAAGQSVVGGEWMLKGLESKVVAYVLLLFSLNCFLDGKDTAAAILLGLTTSVHVSVGLISGFAIGVGLLSLRYPWRRLLKIFVLAAIFALPGLIPLVSMMGGAAASRADWRFLVLVRMPVHLDPFSFNRRAMLLLLLLLAFCWMHFRTDRENRTLRFLIAFQAGLAAVFIGGVLFRALGWFELLRIFPFRVLPLFAPLLFFFHLMSAYHHRQSAPPAPALALVALAALVSFTSLPGSLMDQESELVTARRPLDDLGHALGWMASHTPNGSVAILPPWRKDAWQLARRAQVADWDGVRYDRVAEWLRRMEAMVGPLEHETAAVANDPAVLEERFSSLTEAQVEAIASQYGAAYLVSKTPYAHPVLFQSGRYRVYALGAAQPR